MNLEPRIEKEKNRALKLLLLIVAGEAIFLLPFVIPRIFRPTVLDVFSLNNADLGMCFSVYGVVAMVSYLAGGPLADRWAPRKLMALALALTALGGVVFAFYPPFVVQLVIYGLWGFSTIFLFWSPMIKATRIWGGRQQQGRAFSWLDGGRGLVGAVFGLLGVVIFEWLLRESQATASIQNRQDAFQIVYFSAIGLLLATAILVWIFLKWKHENTEKHENQLFSLQDFKEVIQLKAVRLLSVIILCAYFAYKVTDVISLYAADVMEMSEVEAAKVGTLFMFIRPLAGFLIGFFIDRFNVLKALIISFLLCSLGAIILSVGGVKAGQIALFFTSVFILGLGVYSLRSLYFSVMKVGKIPLAVTGTAVGIVSIVGYTPDVFSGPIIGYFLDNYSGFLGFQYLFLFLLALLSVGTIFSFYYYRQFTVRDEIGVKS